MKNVMVIKKEYVFCPKDNEEITIEECIGCACYKRREGIGMNHFVKCDYMEENK
jgi:hypothetical protein